MCDPFQGMTAEESVWKHDLHDSSTVCKKLNVSEGVYVHTTNLKEILSWSCLLALICVAIQLLLLSWFTVEQLCLFKSFLGSFPALA